MFVLVQIFQVVWAAVMVIPSLANYIFSYSIQCLTLSDSHIFWKIKFLFHEDSQDTGVWTYCKILVYGHIAKYWCMDILQDTGVWTYCKILVYGHIALSVHKSMLRVDLFSFFTLRHLNIIKKLTNALLLYLKLRYNMELTGILRCMFWIQECFIVLGVLFCFLFVCFSLINLV